MWKPRKCFFPLKNSEKGAGGLGVSQNQKIPNQKKIFFGKKGGGGAKKNICVKDAKKEIILEMLERLKTILKYMVVEV